MGRNTRSSFEAFARKLYPYKSSPVTGLEWPGGFQEVKVPKFMTTAQGGGKIVILTHRPHLPLGNSPGTHYC